MQKIQSIDDGSCQAAREKAKPEVLALLRAGIEMDLLFRTDEDVLADSTGSKLEPTGRQPVSANPEIQIRLDGFADERGDDETYNQELSARRAGVCSRPAGWQRNSGIENHRQCPR